MPRDTDDETGLKVGSLDGPNDSSEVEPDLRSADDQVDAGVRARKDLRFASAREIIS
eukprot:CAMPEP_0185762632 /NCGR_PEP_ID=MMETSP1174-20130828/21591_1 /TAXON_ID=35687 /ORGANISM="Dictyocha speculum, Strain CCMP1381" /LENGTH=56 /DNA_ID=CAMNT_0028444375 /DNA_START=26 /DNA_END=193 /DNA_ORIENTATION=-